MTFAWNMGDQVSGAKGGSISPTRKVFVVKCGTSTLSEVYEGLVCLDREKMLSIARQCCELQRQGHWVVLVSSGAIVAGREQLRLRPGDGRDDMERVELGPPGKESRDGDRQYHGVIEKQGWAAVGQCRLMSIWRDLFAIFRVPVGQLLVTKYDMEDSERKIHVLNSMYYLLEQGIVPIVNENDATAVDEIKVGDNDNLSSYVATLIHAHTLLLITDQPGLLTSDPQRDPQASLISVVDHIDKKIYDAASGGSSSGVGTGGMLTKIQAAERATLAGTRTVIVPGKENDVILRALLENEVNLGTQFLAQTSGLQRSQFCT